jgi:hypothetical protein
LAGDLQLDQGEPNRGSEEGQMKSLRFASVGILVLASAVLCYGQRGRGASGGHIGGPPSAASTGVGHSGTGASSHGPAEGGASQSQKRSTEQLLDQNSKLSDNLQKLLPAGTTPQQACAGFKNLGQCVAAIHVSNNLGISFDDLKAKITGDKAESLGKSIHDLKPDADAKTEEAKAKKQTKEDMATSGS